MGRILRHHKFRVGTSMIKKMMVKADERYDIGTLQDMINGECPSFHLQEGNWEIWDYYDHAYYLFGYYESCDMEGLMNPECKSLADDSHYGITKKGEVSENLLQIFYEEDMENFEEGDKLTIEEWLQDLDISSIIDGINNEESAVISSGRGDTTFIIYTLHFRQCESQKTITAFWLFSASYEPLEQLCSF